VVVVDQVVVVGLALALVGMLRMTNPAFDSHAVQQFVAPQLLHRAAASSEPEGEFDEQAS